MEDLTKTAKERFLERLRAREDFITIPERGTTILSFTNRHGSDKGINIQVEIDDRSRRKYRLDSKVKKSRRITVRHELIDIGAHPDVKYGCIHWDVAETFSPALSETVQFVNLYLGYNISVSDVNEQFYDKRSRNLLIRIRRNSLGYTGFLRVKLI